MSNQITLFPLFLSPNIADLFPPSGTNRKWAADKTAVQSLAISADGKTLLSAGNSIKSWNLETKKLIQVCFGHPPPKGMSISKFSLPSMQKWRGHTTAVRGLAFTPQGTSFVSYAAEDRFVDIWSTQNAENENVLAALALDNNPIMVDTHAPSADRPTVLFILDFFFFFFFS